MKSILKALAQQGDISYLSYYFAEFISDQAAQPMDSLLAYSAALVSEANQQGDVCISLDRFQSGLLFNSERLLAADIPVAPNIESWCHLLLKFDCVGSVGEIAPLILEDRRLYLYRYWYYESQIVEFMSMRLEDKPDIDASKLTQDLHSLYPVIPDQTLNQQKLAIALAVKRRFAVISGGPGTGKTTTVINILSVLLAQQPDMRIQLAAPTGKAAARLMESIRRSIELSNLEQDTLKLIPTQASTIHRLLGFRRDGFRYSRQHRLPVDYVVIDEASMVDLTLMYRLFDALPAQAGVILLGDRDQLASVAAGNVLGDITGQGQVIEYSQQQTDSLSSILEQPLPNPAGKGSPISDSIALLTHSYRFDAQSGIAQLAQTINQGNSEEAIEFLLAPGNKLAWHENTNDQPHKTTYQTILSSYQAVVTSDTVEQAFDAFEHCRVLCAVHTGNFGVQAINLQITRSMRTLQWISPEENFCGKPIIIASNDYELGLFNGDIGLLWYDDDKSLRAYFHDVDQSLRSLPISSLPGHEPAWAMTVHKSQGSEFDSVILILPGENHRQALSRELLYTAVTRARHNLTIDASKSAIEISCKIRSQRHSGLAAKLGWP